VTLEAALALVAALLVWVLIPGPAILTVVGRSLSGGFRSTLSPIGGILLGDLFYISLVFLGLVALGQSLGEVFVVVRVLAALSLPDALAIMGIFVAVLGTAFTLYAFAASRARRLFEDPRRRRLLNRSSGLLLVGAGATVLFKRA
jgi:threonine/homoserine/homoserine lactone efflux protein